MSNLTNDSIHDSQGVKLLSRLKLNFSHLNEHKFRQNFKECVNPVRGRGSEIKSTLFLVFPSLSC